MSRKVIRARIHLIAAEDGGRPGPVTSGYRSLIRFEGTDLDFGFELRLDADSSPGGLAPGDVGQAQLSLWAVDALPTLSCGQSFELREGTRVFGHGRVTQP